MKEPFDAAKTKRSIKIDAIGVGVPVGAAEVFAEKATKAMQQKFKTKSVITERDLNLALAKELAKYNADLAYVYKNRDTII